MESPDIHARIERNFYSAMRGTIQRAAEKDDHEALIAAYRLNPAMYERALADLTAEWLIDLDTPAPAKPSADEKRVATTLKDIRSIGDLLDKKATKIYKRGEAMGIDLAGGLDCYAEEVEDWTPEQIMRAAYGTVLQAMAAIDYLHDHLPRS